MASSKEEGAAKPREAAGEKSKFGEKTRKRLDKAKEKIERLSDEAKKLFLLEKITNILSSLNKDSFEKNEQDSINEIVKDFEVEVNAFVTSETKLKKTSEKEKKSDINPERLGKIQKLKSDLAEAKAELEKKGILKINSKTLKEIDSKIKALSTKKEEADFVVEHDVISEEIAALMFLEAPKDNSAGAPKVDQSIEEDFSRKMSDARKDITNFFDNLTSLEDNHSRSVKWVAEFGDSFAKLQEKAKILEKLLKEKKYDEFNVALIEFNSYQDAAYDRVVKSEREYFVGLDKNKFKTILSVIKDRISDIKANPTLLNLKTELEKSWASLSVKPEAQEAVVFEQNLDGFKNSLEAFLAAAPADIRQEFEERLIGKVAPKEKKDVPASKDPVVVAKVDFDVENKRDQKIWKDAEKKWRVLQNIFNKMSVAKRFSKDRFVSDRIDIIEDTLADAYSAPTPRVFADDMGRFNYAFDLLLSKLEREAPEMKAEFEAQLAGETPSWEKTAPVKKSDTVKAPDTLVEAKIKKQGRMSWINIRFSELAVLKEVLQNKATGSKWVSAAESADNLLKIAEKDLAKDDEPAYIKSIEAADAALIDLWKTLPQDIRQEYDDKWKKEAKTAEVTKNTTATKNEKNSLVEAGVDIKFIKEVSAIKKRAKEVYEKLGDLHAEMLQRLKENSLIESEFLQARTIQSQTIKTVESLLKRGETVRAENIMTQINLDLDRMEKIVAGKKPEAAKTTTPPEDPEKKKKEIAQRKQEVEEHKLNFNRFLIDIAEDGLKEDIKSINEILEEASKNVHDASVYDAHIDDYKKKIESLISKADQLSKKTVHTEAKDSGGTPEQKYRLSIYSQDYGLLIGIIDDRNDPALEQRLHKSVLEVENSFVAAEDHLDAQTLNTAYEKLRDFIDIIYVESDRTIYQEFRQRLSDIHYPNAAASMPPEPQPHVLSGPPKKGFWTKAKEFGKGLFSKEGAKAVGKASYETVTSLLGVKLVTDLVGWGFGVGDLAQRSKEKKQAELSKENIKIAYYNLLRSFEIAERGLELHESEQVPKRMAELRYSIESSNLSPEAQEQVWQRLEFIYAKYRENTDKAKEERREEVKRLLDGYLHSKIENVRIAKDALNLALTVSGMSLLRGVMFAGTSLLERAKKSSREYARQTSGMVGAKSETAFMAKDVFVNSAIETGRALLTMGAKKDSSGVTRAVDFVKALGTVARGLGIFNLTVTGGSAEQNIDNLVRALREKGVVETISDNFVANVEKVGHAATNPTEGVERAWDKVTGQEANQSLGKTFEAQGTDQGNNSPIDPSDLVSRPDSMPSDPIYAFAAEHGLSQKSYEYLHQFPALADHPESLNRIFESSHVGADVKSYFTGSNIDNLIEAGGERKAVIFEELVKADKAAAAAFLENQKFNSRHLGYLSDFAGKDGKIDYQKFVENYNPENKKMSLALFRAMQGKENTELANAGFIRAATEDRKGATVRIKDDVIYLGLDKDGKPILSGDGEVQVRETLLKKGYITETQVDEIKNITPLSPEDRLRLNADSIRSMKGELPQYDDVRNAVAANMSSDAERAELAQLEVDNNRFAQLGEEHVGVLEKARSGTYDKKGNFYPGKTIGPIAESDTRAPINPYPESVESRGELVGKTVASYKADGELVRMEKAVEVKNAPVVPVSKPAETVPAPKVEKNSTPDKGLEPIGLEVPENFVSTYQAMAKEVSKEMLSSFDFRGGAGAVLNARIQEHLVDEVKPYINFTQSDEPVEMNEDDSIKIQQLFKAVKEFNSQNSNWKNDFYKAVIPGDDKEMDLIRLVNRDTEVTPVLANGGNTAIVWDASQGKDIMVYDKSHTFKAEGKNLVMFQNGAEVARFEYSDSMVSQLKTLPI